MPIVRRLKPVRKKSNPYVYIEVTTKSLYCFEEGSINGWSTKEVIEDWFLQYPITFRHATRDSHKLANLDVVTDVRPLDKTKLQVYHAIYEAYMREAAPKARRYQDES